MSRMQLQRTVKEIIEVLDGYGDEAKDRLTLSPVTKKQHLINLGKAALGAQAGLSSPRTLMASGFVNITEQLQNPRIIGDERTKLFNLVSWYLVYKSAHELQALLTQRSNSAEIEIKYLHLAGQLESSLAFAGAHSRLRRYLMNAKTILAKLASQLDRQKYTEQPVVSALPSLVTETEVDYPLGSNASGGAAGATAARDEAPENWSLVLFTPINLNTYDAELSLALACDVFGISQTHIEETDSREELENIKTSVAEQYALLRRRYHPDKGGTEKGFISLENLHGQVLTAIDQRLAAINPANLAQLQAAAHEALVAAEHISAIKQRYQEAIAALPTLTELERFATRLEVSFGVSVARQNEILNNAQGYLRLYHELMTQQQEISHEQYAKFDEQYFQLKLHIKSLYKNCIAVAPESPAKEVYLQANKALDSMADALNYLEDNLEMNGDGLRNVMERIQFRYEALRKYQRDAAVTTVSVDTVPVTETVTHAETVRTVSIDNAAGTATVTQAPSTSVAEIVEPPGVIAVRPTAYLCGCLPWKKLASISTAPSV